MAYLGSFQSLAMSIPGNVDLQSAVAVKLNPALNDFQRSVAEEVLELIMNTTGLIDSVAYAVLGYLSPVDAMKRRRIA